MSPAMVGARSLRVGARTFEIVEQGPATGPLVLLLHGFPQTTGAWQQLLAPLAGAGWRAVALLQRGYSPGARPPGRRAYHVDALADDVLDVADALGSERFHVVGHDWGGVVAWRLGGTHPLRLRSLTSLATPHPAALARSLLGLQGLRSTYAAWFQLPLVPEWTLTAGGGRLLRLALRRSGLSERWVEEYARHMDLATMHAALQWYRATPALTMARMADITVPTLYLWGNQDAALGRAAAEATADHVTGPYEFRELDASHWLPEDHSGAVVGPLLGHLAATKAAASRSG